MFLSEKVTYRVKRACMGIAMGMAIWLMYVSYLILTDVMSIQPSMSSPEVTLTPIAPSQK